METKIEEIWKDVVGYEGLYEVSDIGRVRSLTRKVDTGHQVNTRIGRILRSAKHKNGYLKITLCRNKHRITTLTHRLVATAFLLNTQNKPFVNHKDGDKTNNNLSNLEWVTAKENHTHAIVTGLAPNHIGENNQWAKLNNEAVLEIRRLYRKGKWGVKKPLAERFGVSESVVLKAASKDSWKHI